MLYDHNRVLITESEAALRWGVEPEEFKRVIATAPDAPRSRGVLLESGQLVFAIGDISRYDPPGATKRVADEF